MQIHGAGTWKVCPFAAYMDKRMKNKTKNLFLKQYGTLFTETRQAQGRRQHTA